MAETKVRELRTHCKRGHEMNEKNTRIKSKGGGRYARECRACHNIRSSERRRNQNGSRYRQNGTDGKPEIRRATAKSILSSTAFGKDCFSHAQIMAFRRGE